MRVALLIALPVFAGTAQAQIDPRERLAQAQAQSAAAGARAARLERAAAAQRDSARQARAAEAAVAQRIVGAQADIAAAEARVAIVARAQAVQRARLAERQGPVARLLAALQSLAARPPLVAVAQPGSVDDLVHVRAALGTALPVVRARTAGVRAELAATRTLQRRAAQAAQGLIDGRRALEAQRLALIQLEAQHRYRSRALGRDALYESDRALALGERARDLVGSLSIAADEAGIARALMALSGPLPRPGDAGSEAAATAVYRLPVAGRVVTGLGEISDAGVRSRGLTLACRPDARVNAPAGGQVRYAGPFRQYGRVVVIDHGDGWTSAVTGLGDIDVALGDRVRAGDRIGRAQGDGASGDEPRVTVELRRRGRPVDLTALIG
ncbi:MAG: peptidoglycan DD-metalloendopeptidase family protein [Pseudomonadota bacterium]